VPDEDFHILVQGHKKADQTFYRKTLKLKVQKRGYFGLVDPEQRSGVGLGEAPPLYDVANGCSQPGLGIELGGIRQPQVGKNVAAAGNDVFARCPRHTSPHGTGGYL
jgi:hypothetical protein